MQTPSQAHARLAGMADERLADKRAFFHWLDALRRDDEGPDDGLLQAVIALNCHRQKNQIRARASVAAGRVGHPPAKRVVDLTASSPLRGSHDRKRLTSSEGAPCSSSRPRGRPRELRHTPRQKRPVADTQHRYLDSPERHAYKQILDIDATASRVWDTNLREQQRRSRTGPADRLCDLPQATAPCATPIMSAGAKRKRGSAASTQIAPASQQFLDEVLFLYIPNDEKCPARKFRIRKALEYGAKMTRSWGPHVSHIIVDNHITLADVLKFTGLTQLPEGVVLVKENYIPDCVSYRCLVDPGSILYRVQGMDLVEQPRVSASAGSAAAGGSLPEPKRRASGTRDDDTPQSTAQATPAPPNLVIESSANHSMGREGPVVKDAGVGSFGALDEVITEARATIHLPLDLDDEEPSPDTSAQGEYATSDSDEGPRQPKAAKKKNVTDPGVWQQNFTCMQPQARSESEQNPNFKTMELLQEMASYYDSTHDSWRTIAYRKAISVLRKQTVLVATKEHAESLPFIGERIAAKIEEIVCTNRLRRLESTKSDPDDEALRVFLQIYGVGYSQASRWVQHGYKTIEDIKMHEAGNLTAAQKIGLAHLSDFSTRIPRAEVAGLGYLIKQAVLKIDEDVQITIGGSYRRGAKDSGDIDLVITKPNADIAYLRTILLQRIVPALFEQDILTAVLAETSKSDGSKWQGACHLSHSVVTPDSPLGMQLAENPLSESRPWRRIDLLLVPWDELGAAMIYFTGNDIFNRSVRLLARKKGYRLNQRGLYKDVLRDRKSVRLTEGTKVAGKDEKEIFDLLGVPWTEPEMRNC